MASTRQRGQHIATGSSSGVKWSRRRATRTFFIVDCLGTAGLEVVVGFRVYVFLCWAIFRCRDR